MRLDGIFGRGFFHRWNAESVISGPHSPRSRAKMFFSHDSGSRYFGIPDGFAGALDTNRWIWTVPIKKDGSDGGVPIECISNKGDDSISGCSSSLDDSDLGWTGSLSVS